MPMEVSVFMSYHINLEQMSVCVLFDKNIFHKNLKLQIESQSIHFESNDTTFFAIQLDNDDVHLKPQSVRQLKILKSNDNCETNFIQFSFIINAKFESVPKKRIVTSEVQLPPNFELLNDWIFCHNHHQHSYTSVDSNKSVKQYLTESSDANGDDSDDTSSDSLNGQLESQCSVRTVDLSVVPNVENCQLESQCSVRAVDSSAVPYAETSLTCIDQIMVALSSEESLSKFLFESDNKKLSLFIQVINRAWIVSQYGASIDAKREDNAKLKFINVSSVYYKLFINDHHDNGDSFQLKELSSYRRSFQIEWYTVRHSVFNTFLESLIHSTKRMLPLDTRLETDNGFVHGYLDF